MIRSVYRLLSLAGDAKALLRGLGPFARRKGRQAANRHFNRALRRVLKP